jgi:hypothetical protein
VSAIFSRVSKDLRFPVLNVTSTEFESEPLGSKEKFWYSEKGKNFLFKRSREGTGEHWAEKAACELALLLKLPHAVYNLAFWRRFPGVVTPNFSAARTLAHGNEFLARLPEYEKVKYKKYKQPLYTLSRVLAVLDRAGSNALFRSSVKALSALEIFTGYLLFDAWISNQDRHHENWGFLFSRGSDESLITFLAPTFDHAASLGSIESDKSKFERLRTKSPERGVEAFVKKARSAFHREREGGRMSTLEAFETIARKAPQGSVYWMNRLEDVTDKEIEGIFARFDENIISDISIEFAMEMLRINKERILGCDIT